MHAPKIRDRSLKFCYSYRYDPLNRITAATDNTGNYNLSNVTYDKNGNIETLSRKGHTNSSATLFGDMDVLDYDYSGNKLTKVTDIGDANFGFKDGVNQTTEYIYDSNGNMISDANKGITGISYNHFNVPTKVTVSGSNNGTIDFVYDADGIKLQKIKTENGTTTTTDYSGNYIYENGTLQFFKHPEGYIEPDGSGGYEYVYSYFDHLGNIRLSYSDLDGNGAIDPSNEILEETNFYPFGLEHRGYNNAIVGTENNHQTYQGQELEEELGKNTLAYQWRDYDPAIGRFNKIDRFAEKYANLTPYHFASNNPIRFIEVAGDSLKIDGSKKGVKAFNKTVNDNLGGLYDVNRNGDTGQVTVTRNGKEGKLTKSQSKFLGTLNKVIGDKKTTSFKVLAKGEKGTKNFPIGDNGLRSDGLATEPGVHLIDMGDVNAFPNIGGGIISNAGVLSHELQEGFDIQVGGKTPLSAHKAGFATQAGIDGIRITAGASINATGTQMSIPVIRRGAGNKPVSATIQAQLKNNDIIKIINNEN